MQRHFDDVQLGSVELFCLAAEQGGFTAAAVATGVTPAAVSRSVARLEARLGIRLFHRTTRVIRLTDAGERYYQQCRSALNQLIEAEHEVSGEQLTPAGQLRISLPTSYGHHRVLPLLSGFRARYPQVVIQAHIGNRNVDLANEGYDLAVRAGTPADSSLVARKLEDAALIIVASPEYLAQAGQPQSLSDLERHTCVQFELPSSGRLQPWLLREQGQDLELNFDSPYRCSEDVLSLVTLARHGAGLAQVYRYSVEEELARGTLVEVLPSLAGRSRPFSLLYPERRHMPLRVRVFIEFLVDHLANTL